MATIFGSKKKPLSPNEVRRVIPTGGVTLTRSEVENVYKVNSRENGNVSCWMDASSLDIPQDDGNYVPPAEYEAAFRRMRAADDESDESKEAYQEAKQIFNNMISDCPGSRTYRRMIMVQNSLNSFYGLEPEKVPNFERRRITLS